MSRMTGIEAGKQGMLTINVNCTNRQEVDSEAGKITNKGKSSAIFARDLGIGQDSILAKKQKAQKEAMKIIRDVFVEDMKSDAEQEAREKHIEKLKKQNEDKKSQIKDIDKMREGLMEQYEVAEDDEEQQELELIRKARAAAKDPFGENQLTAEEKEQYENLKERGFTEYQEKSLALDDDEESIQKQMADNNRDIATEEDAIWQTDMLRLRKHPMKDAAKQAAEILEAARKDMIGDLFDEAKDTIDEKAEEAKETQKEKEEEKKEKEEEEAVKEAKKIEREILIQKAQADAEERLEEEKAKERARNQMSLHNQLSENFVNGIDDGVDKAALAEQKIKDLLAKMNLLPDDVKGAAVNDKV